MGTKLVSPGAKAAGAPKVSAQLSAKETAAIDRLVEAGFFLNRSDFLRAAAREKLGRVEVLEVRDIDREKARSELLEYFISHPDSFPSDAAAALKLDLGLVMEVCRALLDSGKLEESR
jgi:Arc/MetJ-type ribon-helix-helix transcriptional regulator